MKLYEKILMDINKVGKSTHMSSIEVSKLHYDINANDDIREAYSYLVHSGYIRFHHTNNKINYVERLPQGITYFENKRQNSKKMWTENAWIPIIVAFVTTLLTNYMPPKLPSIIEWFSHTLAKMIS